MKHIIQRKDGNSEGKFLKSVELVDEQLTCNICQYFVGLSDQVKKKKIYCINVDFEVYSFFVKFYK